MGFRRLFQRKPEAYQSQPGPQGFWLCYREVFMFRRWGGRSSSNHSNLAVKQQSGSLECRLGKYRLITLTRTTLPAQAEHPARGEGAPMSHVFVLDNDRRPLSLVHPGTA